MPALREWAEETAAAFTADVGVSLRVDVPEGRRRQFRAVLQLHTAADPALVVEAARLWHEPTETERLLGPRAETATLLALRRGARVWPPLDRLLKDATPDQLRLTDDEAFDLLSDATDTLRAAGIDVHWPRELVKALTATAEIRQRTAPGSSAEGMLDADTLLDFRWQFSLGGEPLTEAEMDALAEARRPLVRLRDQWVLADPKPVARARRRRMEPLTPMEALGAALTGGVERDGETLRCAAVGALGDLVARIRDPESRTPVRGMRLSTVILPVHRWSQGQKIWQRAEALGFHAAYTYDQLSWRTFRDGPWFGAVPTLTAAAAVTESIRLGTLVTSVKPCSPITR